MYLIEGKRNTSWRTSNSSAGSTGISIKWNIYGGLILFKPHFFLALRQEVQLTISNERVGYKVVWDQKQELNGNVLKCEKVIWHKGQEWKIQKNLHRTRETNQGDIKMNIIMIGLLSLLPKWVSFLLGQSSKTGDDKAPLSLPVSGSATKEV